MLRPSCSTASASAKTRATSRRWTNGSRPVRRCRRRPASSRAISSRKQIELSNMLVDSHCHLDFPDFAEDLDAIVARAEAAGIGRIVTISTRVKRLGGPPSLAQRLPNVYCSVGPQPHNPHEEDGTPPS